MIVAVADTGPLIHLDEIDSLELLSVIDEVLIPVTVHEELEAGGIPQALSEVQFELVEADGDSEWSTTDLDPGEVAALQVASDRNAVLLTDDFEARSMAKEGDIEVHGSIGVIALAFNHGEINRDDAARLMRSLQDETSLYVTDSVVERGIELLDIA